MNYHGPLYGKCGKRYIPLKLTSKEVDLLELKLATERALADRLAGEIESWAEIMGDHFTPMSCDEALAAWKEARK